MKGILLAGGTGSRLWPITLTVNKHFLPIYSKPMIYYPFSILMTLKLKDVLIIADPDSIPLYRKLFGTGSTLGMNIQYAVQEKPDGIANALVIAEEFLGGDSSCLVLGDNIFYGHGLPEILNAAKDHVDSGFADAEVFAYSVTDPERYGVVEFDQENKVVSLEEKPIHPKSSFAVPGIYFYNTMAPSLAKMLKPSPRGEVEITDLNKVYMNSNKLFVSVLPRGIAWLDTGTPNSLMEASSFVQAVENRQSQKICCPEEIAYRNGWIDSKDVLSIAAILRSNDYSAYLKSLVKGV